MDAKILKDANLDITCKTYVESIKVSPSGKVLTTKEAESLANLGIDMSNTVATDTNLATLNLGGGRFFKGLTAAQVLAIITTLEAARKNASITEVDRVLLTPKQFEFRTVRKLIKPIAITFDDGTVVDLPFNLIYGSSALSALVPESYFATDVFLDRIQGYSVSFNGSSIRVGCHSYVHDSLIAFLTKVHTHLLT